MDINISYYTAKGKRQNNEDAVSLLEGSNGLLAIVADGLGGHEAGEVASSYAVSAMNRILQSRFPDEDELIDAIQQTNQEIYEMQDPQHRMHTTVAALWLGDHSIFAANVGDSRIYQFRDGRIIYQSMDHSVAQMAVLVGELERSEIRFSKDRNKLIRVVGDANPPKVDSAELTVQAEDRFLLCSDGFWEPVTEEYMLETAAATKTAQQWLSLMRQEVERTNNPSQDNHTAIALIVNELINYENEIYRRGGNL